MTTKQVLQAARDYITNPKKWIKGELEYDGRVCAAGAIHKIKPNVNFQSDPAITALASVLPPIEVDDIARITRYNDSPTTTHECILAAFDAAIERAEP